MSLTPLCLLGALMCLPGWASAQDREPVTQQSINKCTFVEDFRCTANPGAALTITATDERGKLVQKLAAMQQSCSVYTSVEECSNTSDIDYFPYFLCNWNGLLSKCEASPWLGVPWLLTCPGSKMASFFNCFQFKPWEAYKCTNAPGCTYINRNVEIPADYIAVRESYVAARLPQRGPARDASGRPPNITGLVPASAQSPAYAPMQLCVPKDLSDNSSIIQALWNLEDPDGQLAQGSDWWGDCITTTLLKQSQSACNFTTESACQEFDYCRWAPVNSGRLSNASQRKCDLDAYGMLEWLALGSGGDFGAVMTGFFEQCGNKLSAKPLLDDAAVRRWCEGLGTLNYDASILTAAMTFVPTTKSETKHAGGLDQEHQENAVGSVRTICVQCLVTSVLVILLVVM